MKSLDTFDFTAMSPASTSLDGIGAGALRVSSCARDNIIVLGNSGTGRPTLPWPSAWRPASAVSRLPSPRPPLRLVHQLQEARDERRLLRLQQNLAAAKLLIIDELGYVPLSQTGAELFRGLQSAPVNEARRSLPPTCRSRNGPACSAPSA